MVTTQKYRIWIGYDTSEARVYDVLVKSIKRRASIPVEIYPLRQDYLRSLGLYWRQRDPLASTEFSFSRFLVPCLAGYNGPALFVDCDFIFLTDIKELFDLYNPYYAIQCVQHDFVPKETTKMGGLIQSVYHRKNWTSLFMVNSGHPSVINKLTPHEVNTRSGKYLHQLEWVNDEFIGDLPKTWNSLDYDPVDNPKAVHLTTGTRAIHGNDTYYSDLWEEESKR